MRIHWFFKVTGFFAAIFIIWLLFYYALPEILPAQRVESSEVYGLIFSDQIWGGNIKIVGDVYTLTNSKVTILPGTKIKVAINSDKSNMDLLPWHRKEGVNTGDFYKGVKTGEPFWNESRKIQIHLNEVEMIGEPSNTIEITSESEDPSPYDFNILSIKSGKITHALFSNYRRFETSGDLEIMNSSFSNTGECALCITGGIPRIYNNTFENSKRESIWIKKASPIIDNNLFINLTGDGIKIDPQKIAAPQIVNNVFEMPQRAAIDIVSGSQLGEILIARNIFSGNSQIKIACDAQVKIRDNSIFGLISFTNGCTGGYIFGPNFWGTIDPRIILSEKILSKYDRFRVEIPNVLFMAPKGAGRK
jgi:hypothetical protein